MKKVKDMKMYEVNKEISAIKKAWKEGVIEDFNTPRYQELLLRKKSLTKESRDEEIRKAKLMDEWIKMNNGRRRLADSGADILSLEKMKEIVGKEV